MHGGSAAPSCLSSPGSLGTRQSFSLIFARPRDVLGSWKKSKGEMLYFLLVSFGCPPHWVEIQAPPIRDTWPNKQSSGVRPGDPALHLDLVMLIESSSPPTLVYCEALWGSSNRALGRHRDSFWESCFPFSLIETCNNHGEYLLIYLFTKCQALFLPFYMCFALNLLKDLVKEGWSLSPFYR